MLDWLKFRARAFKYRHKIDPHDLAFMMKIIHKGDCVVDIGAHKGGYLYWMQKATGKKGRVFAFEPQKELADYLQNIVSRYGYSQTVVFNQAVSNQSGQAILHTLSHRSTTGATLEKDVFSENDAQIAVSCTTLDNFFSQRENAGYRVKLVKVDVESHELAVFEGAQKVLKEHRPVLMFECEQRVYQNKSIFDVFNFLTARKYKGYFFFNGKLHSLDEFDLAIHQDTTVEGFPLADNYANNFIFVPQEADLPQ